VPAPQDTRLRFVRFADRRLERAFLADTRQDRHRVALLGLSCVWVFYLGMFLFTWSELPSEDWGYVYYFHLVSGLALLALLLVIWRLDDPAVASALEMAFLVLMGLCLVYMSWWLGQPLGILYYLGFIFFNFLITGVLRLGFLASVLLPGGLFVIALVAWLTGVITDLELSGKGYRPTLLRVCMIGWVIMLALGVVVLVFRERRIRIEYGLQRALKEANDRLMGQRRELAELATHDELTGLANRRLFFAHFGAELRRASRMRFKLLLVFMDIDHFKQFNDRYGHAEGDRVLQQVGRVLSIHARRPGDLSARYGGEEFVLVRPCEDTEPVEAVLDCILQGIRALEIPHLDNPTGVVTLSAGAVWGVPGVARSEDLADVWIRKADEMLYLAKSEGKNRFCLQVMPVQP
jgi:diguanylate cyclase (GGDEF)-like protein